jgi:hypothetical protein
MSVASTVEGVGWVPVAGGLVTVGTLNREYERR